jgi:hypothetical protein
VVEVAVRSAYAGGVGGRALVLELNDVHSLSGPTRRFSKFGGR